MWEQEWETRRSSADGRVREGGAAGGQPCGQGQEDKTQELMGAQRHGRELVSAPAGTLAVPRLLLPGEQSPACWVQRHGCVGVALGTPPGPWGCAGTGACLGAFWFVPAPGHRREAESRVLQAWGPEGTGSAVSPGKGQCRQQRAGRFHGLEPEAEVAASPATGIGWAEAVCAEGTPGRGDC